MTPQQKQINEALQLIANAKYILEGLLKLESQSTEIQLTAEQTICNNIHKAVIKQFGVNPMTKGRKKEVVMARHGYRYLLKKYTSWTLEKIGIQTGTNDHKSVLHSIRVAQDMIDTDKDYASLITKCEEIL